MSDDRSIPFEIISGLYIGNLRSSRNRDFLDSHGITHVLTIAGDIEPEFPKRYKYKIVNVDDSADDDLAGHFEKCCRFIDKARNNGAVLVHCQVGISRSPAIAIAYLMSRERMTFTAALALLKSKDELVAPNDAFLDQLRAYEVKLRAGPS